MEVFGSNIISENGESYIPASQRPDGTWRKARRVKEGYVPQEEVPLYESKGKQFANRMSKPVTITLPTGEIARQAIPGLFIVEEKEQKSRNKKKGKSSNKQTTDELSKKLENIKVKEVSSEKKPKQDKQTAPNQKLKQPETSQAVDPAKRLKNLKKRLREVEALEEKIKSGSIAKPDPDQLKKVERKNDLLLEIEQLEKKV